MLPTQHWKGLNIKRVRIYSLTTIRHPLVLTRKRVKQLVCLRVDAILVNVTKDSVSRGRGGEQECERTLSQTGIVIGETRQSAQTCKSNKTDHRKRVQLKLKAQWS